MKHQEEAPILRNERIQGEYYQVDFECPRIAAAVQPGQFVHVRFPFFEHRLLRRPFSVYDVDCERGMLSVIYKVVGEGTQHLSGLPVGSVANLMGPLGHGFSLPEPKTTPILVTGGYGCAATFLLAKRSAVPCMCLVGGKTAADLLLIDDYRALNADVRLATEDGSEGHRGLITDVLAEVLDNNPVNPRIYACGPMGMMEAVSKLVVSRGLDAEVSLDHVMCCGVGACFACVVKMKADTPEGWEYVRTCKEGPVFQASRMYLPKG